MDSRELTSLFGAGSTLRSLLENPNLAECNPASQEENKNKLNKKDLNNGGNQDYGSAFLGPNLWDKTLPADGLDFTLEYMDLEEFLTENGIEGESNPLQNDRGICGSPPRLLIPPSPQPIVDDQLSPGASPMVSPRSPVQVAASTSGLARTSSPTVEVHFTPSEQDLALSNIPGQEEFDPRRRQFTDDELKPQPMIKKSKKVFVPDEQKDDKYWNRRGKNNVAAKRSRDARRVKENQIAMRAAYLEKLNFGLKSSLKQALKENEVLKSRLEKYESQ